MKNIKILFIKSTQNDIKSLKNDKKIILIHSNENENSKLDLVDDLFDLEELAIIKRKINKKK